MYVKSRRLHIVQLPGGEMLDLTSLRLYVRLAALVSI